jgi:penicillin amidase
MRLLFRLLAWLTLALAALGGGGAALAYYLAARSLPDYDATRRVADLSAPVEIVRDAWAVPHIFAESDLDAFFALGYVHAQDRLWQMELQRRTAQGRLAEWFGPRAAPVDRTMRALDLDGAAAEALDHQSPETRALLEAYAAGVNARIRVVSEEALGRGAPEFFLFGDGDIAAWTPADSLSVVKLLALRLTSAARAEARRARLVAQLPPEQVADLDPAYPEPGLIVPPALDEDGLDFPADRAEAPHPFSGPFSPFAPPGFGGGSNAWAVDASRSAAGAPLLATDPHLWLSAPSIWMLARISSPGFEVIGGSAPGLPAILIGRNPELGWGLTTVHMDDQDIFLEQLDPEDPGRYRTPEGWADFETREEVIRIKDRPSERILLRRTRHGPVIPPGGDLDFSSITPAGHVAALAWTALEPEDRSLEAMLTLMRARSVEEGAEAARLHLAPAQNVILADAEGVGLVTAGVAPLRSPDSLSQGRMPSLGWRAENDWRGHVPFEDTPQAIRPRSGAVANANNRTTNAPFPAHLTHDWPAPYRIRRIEERLNDRAFHTRESFEELQTDSVSEMARAVLPLVARDLWWGEPLEANGAAGRLRGEVLERMAAWNGDMSAHDAEPLIFAAWMRALTRRLAEDELGALFPEIEGPRPLFVERVFHDIDGASRWCDVVKTPQPESCADMARRALDDALTDLRARFGDDLSTWRWGEAHRAVHVHTPLGFSPGFDLLVNIEHETPGGDHTLNRGGMPGRGPEPFRNVHSAGLRAVYDFADPDRSVFVIATGQSGHPLSRHYDDLGEIWARGDYIPMSFDPEDARAGSVGTTRLRPR